METFLDTQENSLGNGFISKELRLRNYNTNLFKNALKEYGKYSP